MSLQLDVLGTLLRLEPKAREAYDRWKAQHPGLEPSVAELQALLAEATTPERIQAAFTLAAGEAVAFVTQPRTEVTLGDDPSVDA